MYASIVIVVFHVEGSRVDFNFLNDLMCLENIIDVFGPESCFGSSVCDIHWCH